MAKHKKKLPPLLGERQGLADATRRIVTDVCFLEGTSRAEDVRRIISAARNLERHALIAWLKRNEGLPLSLEEAEEIAEALRARGGHE